MGRKRARYDVVRCKIGELVEFIRGEFTAYRVYMPSYGATENAKVLMFINSFTVCETYKFIFIVGCTQNILQCPSEALGQKNSFAETHLGMFVIFGRTGASQKEGAHRPENVEQQRGIFWLVHESVFVYGVLRHSFAAARQSVAYRYYKIYEFRVWNTAGGHNDISVTVSVLPTSQNLALQKVISGHHHLNLQLLIDYH